VWGVHAVETRDASGVEDMVQRACAHAESEGFGEEGDRIVIVAGMPFGSPGATNMIRIASVREKQ
jgi:pyruvate kinase